MLRRSFSSFLRPLDSFARRHIGPSASETSSMLRSIDVSSLDELVTQTVPKAIVRTHPLKIQSAKSESEAIEELREIMEENKLVKSYIGKGYYGTITPNVILRNVLENPLWYTAYTPYQAEISQGRMEMLLNYQTMITDLTGLPVSNASLLDEATAAAEAMYMSFQTAGKKKTKFLISDEVHPQSIAVVKTRAAAIGVEVVVAPSATMAIDETVAGVFVQYPTTDGVLIDYTTLGAQTKKAGGLFIVATDLLALTVLKPPSEFGADVVLGNTQRFGVPMGFGGPHAAFMAVAEEHKRKMPGRVIGISRDSNGDPALRMAMQTREQHIRRDKATSNICTAQALLANTATAYAIYHGPRGLKDIALKVHSLTWILSRGLIALGFKLRSNDFFDTLSVSIDNSEDCALLAKSNKLNFFISANNLNVSLDETTSTKDLQSILDFFAKLANKDPILIDSFVNDLPVDPCSLFSRTFERTSDYLTHPVFNSYHSETELLRYLHRLVSKDLSLATAMIPLGSCTMKLNATSEMIPITWPSVNQLHPFAPAYQTKGYAKMFKQLQKDLCDITGFAAVSLQPNSGSQGEYTGLLVIRAYLESLGQGHRNICLIPTSAHGTNPASAVLAGFKIVVVGCDVAGNIDMSDLKAKAEENSANLACMMATYPSTHGVFEEGIVEACNLIHKHGGQVYMDGANMNAQCGLTSPGQIGADVCHLNLHKTFAIPHGGGGPGMGPIGVAKHLAPFLPTHPLVSTGGKAAIGPVAAAPFSSASILPISWMYIRMLGGEGIKLATQMALLNANYMMNRLAPHYSILYRGTNGRCAHEFILDIRGIKTSCGITEEDIAKRLMDYNFHAPTMSFPVAGTLMIEPTESESKYELDRLCDALISIRNEIKDVEEGRADKHDNVLKGAPHTAAIVSSDNWNRKYTRTQAAYPLQYLRSNKFWPSVGRIDNVFGELNLRFCCASP